MLNAAFHKKFSRMYRDRDTEEDLRRTGNNNNRKYRPHSHGRDITPSPDIGDDIDDDIRSGYSHRGNCRKFITRNPSDSPSTGLPRKTPREHRYNKNGSQPRYRRLDEHDGDIKHGGHGEDRYSENSRNYYQYQSQNSQQQKPKYGPSDIEVWSKKSSTKDSDDRAASRGSRGGDLRSSPSDGSGLRDWLSWRCFLNQNLAHTVLSARVRVGGAPTGAVRTVCAEPDFGHSVVRHILDEYADRDQKPPTSLHENDYLMFGVPRAKLRPETAAVAAVMAAVAEGNESRNSQVQPYESPYRPLLRPKPSTNSIPQSFTIQKCIAERVKAAESTCFPSFRRKKLKRPKKSKPEVSSEPDYLPSRYTRMSSHNEARKISSEGDQIHLLRNKRPYSPWAHVARPRDKIALPPESSFLIRSRSQSSYWSTSSMTLSLTSSSSAEYTGSSSSSSFTDDSSSLYSVPSKPLYRRKESNRKKYPRR